MVRREDYVRELQLGILLIADHIARFKGEDAAVAFAGFRAEGEYAKELPERVNLREFQSGWALHLMYEFAMGLPAPEPSGDFEESALASFINLIPLTDAYGEPAQWPKDPLTVQVLDTFRARRKLLDPARRPTAVFSVRELALLADMSEGAVRNALSAKELASRREDGKVVSDWTDAAAWLSKRRGFKATPDTSTSQLMLEIATASSLKDLLAVVNRVPGVADVLPRKWRGGQWSGNLSEVHEVASAIDIDPEELAMHMTRLWIREQTLAKR